MSADWYPYVSKYYGTYLYYGAYLGTYLVSTYSCIDIYA